MKSYKTLKKEFEKQIKELQKNCKHKNCTWMEYYLAFGHSSGYEVKICNFCNKEVDRRVMK